MSLRSISVDDTPDTEIGPSKIGAEELKKVASSVAVDLTKAAAATNTKAVADASNQSSSSADLLSPPDISLTSISPGDETDATVTITPSSATITPSQSSEMGKKLKLPYALEYKSRFALKVALVEKDIKAEMNTYQITGNEFGSIFPNFRLASIQYVVVGSIRFT